MANHQPNKQSNQSAQESGVVGIFSTPEALKAAAAKVRDLKLQKFDAFSPFPVHGIEEAMGLKRSFLPWVTFVAGLTGATAGAAFQIWTSAVHWPLNVGGKPFISLPAFVPVIFECTILFAGLATAGALIAACKLPKLNPVVLDPSLTDSNFALFVSSSDPQYKEAELVDVLKKSGAQNVRVL